MIALVVATWTFRIVDWLLDQADRRLRIPLDVVAEQSKLDDLFFGDPLPAPWEAPCHATPSTL